MSTPLTPLERAEILQKAALGTLTPADTKRFIEGTRVSLKALPAVKGKAAPKPAKVVPETADVDFF